MWLRSAINSVQGPTRLSQTNTFLKVFRLKTSDHQLSARTIAASSHAPIQSRQLIVDIVSCHAFLGPKAS